MTTRRDLPVLAMDTPETATIPVVPLNFVHPGLSLVQILSILRAYRRMIVLIMIAVLAGTYLLLTLLPKTYTANATLMVNYEVNDPSNGKELPIGLLAGYISTQIELMQNPEVLLAVVDKLKLTQHKDYIKGYQPGRGSLREWAAKQISKNLVIYQGQYSSQLIYVNYSAHKASEAALIGNTIVDTFLAMSQARAQKARLAGQVRSLEAQLAAEEAQMAKLKITLADYHPQVLELQSQIWTTRRNLAAVLQGDPNVTVAIAPQQLPEPAIQVPETAAPQTATPGTATQERTSLETAPIEGKEQNVQTNAGDRPAVEPVYTPPPRSQYANVTIVNRATPPGKAVKPKILTVLALGAIAAFVLGFGLPLAYELFNRRVRCRDDLERHHGVPVLVEFGALPMIRSTL